MFHSFIIQNTVVGLVVKLIIILIARILELFAPDSNRERNEHVQYQTWKHGDPKKPISNETIMNKDEK